MKLKGQQTCPVFIHVNIQNKAKNKSLLAICMKGNMAKHVYYLKIKG